MTLSIVFYEQTPPQGEALSPGPPSNPDANDEDATAGMALRHVCESARSDVSGPV